MPLEVRTLKCIHDLYNFLLHWKDAGASCGFIARAPRRMGLHAGGLFIHAVLFDPGCFPSYAVSCAYGEYKAGCERRGRILTGPGWARCEYSVFCPSRYLSSFSRGLREDPPVPSHTHGLADGGACYDEMLIGCNAALELRRDDQAWASWCLPLGGTGIPIWRDARRASPS